MKKKTTTGPVYVLIGLIIAGAALFHFFPRKAPGDPAPNIEAFFSPQGGIMERIVREIDGAKKSIDIAMYSFTKREIAQALVNAQKRGVRVRIALDQARSKNRHSKMKYFINNGLNPRMVENTMHNKFAVIDGELLITGSYNWTANAEKNNYENILFIKNSPKVIEAYQKQFETLWKIGAEYREQAGHSGRFHPFWIPCRGFLSKGFPYPSGLHGLKRHVCFPFRGFQAAFGLLSPLGQLSQIIPFPIPV